jgi:RNA polymerase sigma-70 factor, ECF subfamily
MGTRTERLRGLLEPVHEQARGFARCLCRARADGDDLFHEALLRAHAKLDALRDDAAFKPWLYRIIISVHRNRLRTAFWRRLLPLGDAPPEDAPREHDYRDGEWSPDAGESLARVRAALATLPAAQRETIVLFELEAWKVEEIAALHRVSVSAVKSRLVRGRERLRAFYERHHDGVDVPALARGDST